MIDLDAPITEEKKASHPLFLVLPLVWDQDNSLVGYRNGVRYFEEQDRHRRSREDVLPLGASLVRRPSLKERDDTQLCKKKLRELVRPSFCASYSNSVIKIWRELEQVQQ